MTTRFGYAVWMHPGETYDEAFDRQRAVLGLPEVVRYFYGPRPLQWPPAQSLRGIPLVVSFSRPPAQVLAGTHDEEVRAFLAQLPRDRSTWVSYEHEMDAKVERGEYAAADVVAAFAHVARLVRRARNSRVRVTLILTGFEYVARLPVYWPGSDLVDVLGVDRYRWTDESVSDLISAPLAAAARFGKPLALTEFGVWRGSDRDRAAFIGELIDRVRGRMELVTYFNADRSDVPADRNWEITALPMAAQTWRRAAVR